MRAFYAMEDKGRLPKGTADRWAKETRSIKNLPEHVKKACMGSTLFTKIAYELFIPDHNPPRSEPQIMNDKIQSAKEEKLQGMSPAEHRTARTHARRNILSRNTRFTKVGGKS